MRQTSTSTVPRNIARKLDQVSAGARALYEFIEPECWRTNENLAKGIKCRKSKIKDYKEELEEARLVSVLLHRNGKRSNPRHEIVKLSSTGNPICKHIKHAVCMGEWRAMDRNTLIECYLRSDWNIVPFAVKEKKPIKGFYGYDWNRTSIEDKMDFFCLHKMPH